MQQAPALRTMLSRSSDYTSTSSAPPPDHLTASLLSSLLDRLKALPQGESAAKLFKEYNVSEAKVDQVRRWVNSPSIDKDRTQVILSKDGEESVKMMVGSWRRIPASVQLTLMRSRLSGLTERRRNPKLCRTAHSRRCNV